jgi:hypothetical protein
MPARLPALENAVVIQHVAVHPASAQEAQQRLA